jgi:hypothetical protein
MEGFCDHKNQTSGSTKADNTLTRRAKIKTIRTMEELVCYLMSGLHVKTAKADKLFKL